jgi:hypothetical protein
MHEIRVTDFGCEVRDRWAIGMRWHRHQITDAAYHLTDRRGRVALIFRQGSYAGLMRSAGTRLCADAARARTISGQHGAVNSKLMDQSPEGVEKHPVLSL